jgi:hypothetical protein
MSWHIWNYLYYPSPQSVLDSTDTGNTSTYTQAQYLARPAGQWGQSTQTNQIQGPSYGTTANNNYGSDYFMDALGYQTGYAPAVAPTEPTTYGAGKWVKQTNGQYQYVAQALSSTSWPTRPGPY